MSEEIQKKIEDQARRKLKNTEERKTKYLNDFLIESQLSTHLIVRQLVYMNI